MWFVVSKMSILKSEFSKTKHAQKTPVRKQTKVRVRVPYEYPRRRSFLNAIIFFSFVYIREGMTCGFVCRKFWEIHCLSHRVRTNPQDTPYTFCIAIPCQAITTYAMIDFKVTLQDDELLYGDYEKMSLISEMMFRKFLQQFKPKRHELLRKVQTLRVAKETCPLLWTYLCDSKCFFFYWQHFISLESAQTIKSYALLNTRFHFVRFSFPLSRQPPWTHLSLFVPSAKLYSLEIGPVYQHLWSSVLKTLQSNFLECKDT